MLFTSKQQGKTAKESPKFPQSQQPGEAMRNFYEVMTIDNQEMTIEAVEIPSGYRWKNLELTISQAPENIKQALEKIASKYEADYLENQTQVKIILSIEREEEQEEWIETVMDEINQELDKQPEKLTIGTTYKVEETDETLKTLQIVTAQDLSETEFERKQELTQQEKEDDTLGQAIAQFLRINEPLARDQKEVKITQQLTNTAEKVRTHYPTITGHNQELITVIERTYKKNTPTEVTITNKPSKQGAVGNYYITEDTLIEVATFEEVQRKTSAEFDDILESMNLYRDPDFQAFYEEQWANFPIITKQRNQTAQDFIQLANEAINEILDYTSYGTAYGIERTSHTIAHTYTDKMNPQSYVFLIIREYK